MKTVFASIVVLVFVLGTVHCGPLHASCKLTWTWSDISCTDVRRAIAHQMVVWGSLKDCDGEKCGYKLNTNTSSEIKGTHTTPVKHYTDDLTMTFKSTKSGDSGNCEVDGNSSSETWYAVLDSSTNYCNLHNLVVGAGLTKVHDFKEMTSDSICTQYSSANCDKY